MKGVELSFLLGMKSPTLTAVQPRHGGSCLADALVELHVKREGDCGS